MTPTVGPALRLRRIQIADQGAFGHLTKFVTGDEVCVTCEHTYGTGPIVQPGTYRCVRGLHKLGTGLAFYTYEITGVEGHTGILFHTGNTEMDSKGCVLLGMSFGILEGAMAVLQSRLAFDAFMNLTSSADEFQLTVENSPSA